MNRSLLRYTLIVALLPAACNAREDAPAAAAGGTAGTEPSTGATQAAPGSAAADPSVLHHPEPPQRPAQKQDSIQLEGTWETFTAKLVQPASSLPFSTYVPGDMVFEPSSSDEGTGYFFYANFGGQKNENAFLLVFLLPQGATQADARRLADAFVTSRSGPRTAAGAHLGSHSGRYFYVAHAWPAEFGDGMGPRTAYIRRQWVWLNDGQSLEATLQPRRE